jgi:hypothetical protein
MDSIKTDRISFLIKLLTGTLIFLTESSFASNPASPLCHSCYEPKNHCRVSVRHIESGGVGYNKGYTTLEGFFASNLERWDIIPFLDLRGHVFDDGYFAANAGIGYRQIVGHRIYGLNAYYDARNTQSLFYSQMGLGFETLGKFWDFRANGYLPVGKQMATIGNPQFEQFSGNQMLISQSYQFSMKGADAELGFPFLPYKWATLYAAVGPYYYIGEIGSSTLGGKIRLNIGLGRYFAVEFSNSYDAMFHNNFQVQITLALPLGKKSFDSKKMNNHQCSVDVPRSRILEPVERDEIIVVGNDDKISVAIDPSTGQPYNFVFVDNTSHSAGTFESPYPTLALAEANSNVGDIIYVFPGDGTTTGMDSGITLKSEQKFWGSGVNQQLQTAQGSVTIPANTSSAPQMTNTAGNGIVLATNNQISGITVKDVTDNGIYGINAQNVQIYSTTVDNSISDQIHLEYTESGSVDLNNLTLINGQEKAIYIQSSGSSFTGAVNNSIMQNNSGFFINTSFTGGATFSFTNNTVDNNYASLLEFYDPASLLISGNTITNSASPSDHPITIIAQTTTGSFSALIENNTISNNGSGAIHFTPMDTNASLTIRQNTIKQNGIGTQGVLLGSTILIEPNSTYASNVQLVVTDNTLAGNSGHVLATDNGGFNELTLTANDNSIDNNAAGGMIFNTQATTLTLNADGNTISNGEDHAIATEGGINIDTVNMTLSNNNISQNRNLGDPSIGVDGVSINHEGNIVNFNVTNNNISDNSGTGLIFYSSNEINTIKAIIENNTISNNLNVASDPGGGGIDLEQYNNLSATINDNTLSNNESYGVYISTTIPTSSVCLGLNGNDSNLGYFLSNDDGSGSTFNLAPLDVGTVNVGTITTSGTITTISECPN